jgi:hypothetical protein
LEHGGTNAVADLQAREEPAMSLYGMMLFIHVSAAICLFIGFGIWLFGIIAIAHASRVEPIRTPADMMLRVWCPHSSASLPASRSCVPGVQRNQIASSNMRRTQHEQPRPCGSAT